MDFDFEREMEGAGETGEVFLLAMIALVCVGIAIAAVVSLILVL